MKNLPFLFQVKGQSEAKPTLWATITQSCNPDLIKPGKKREKGAEGGGGMPRPSTVWAHKRLKMKKIT